MPKTDWVGRAGPADMGEERFDGLTNHGRLVRWAIHFGLELLVLFFQEKRTEYRKTKAPVNYSTVLIWSFRH